MFECRLFNKMEFFFYGNYLQKQNTLKSKHLQIKYVMCLIFQEKGDRCKYIAKSSFGWLLFCRDYFREKGSRS